MTAGNQPPMSMNLIKSLISSRTTPSPHRVPIRPSMPTLPTIPIMAGALMLGVLGGSAISSGLPQPSQESTPTQEMDPKDRSSLTLEQELGWVLSRAAILDLRLHESPSPMDYELTACLLSLASDVAPQDVEIARDMVQAAWLSGDQDMALKATRRVIRLDPKDSVAQLRLISANINKKQTVEERMALYARFLGDTGASIDPAVRSRLALDAALLEREAGNTDGFIRRLQQATQLDITNKAAASLAAQYYSSLRNDPVTILDYQIRLLKADPLDANVHLTIARILAVQGAMEPAQRFLNNAIELFRLDTGRTPDQIEEIRVAVDWRVNGQEEVMPKLTATLNEQRNAAQSLIDSYTEQQLPTEGLTPPEEIVYNLGINKMRLLAAHSADDTEAVRSILTDMSGVFDREKKAILDASIMRGADINALFGQYISRFVDLQSMRAVVGLDADRIRADVASSVEQLPALATPLLYIEPMALYAEGKFEQSLAEARRFESAPVMDLIIAQCLERLNRGDEAIEIYTRLLRTNPLNVYGAFADTRLHSLGVGDRVLTAAGQQMKLIAQRVPGWIDQMITRQGSFFYMGVELDQRVYRDAEQPKITVRLQNTAPIPLGVGPSSPIDSRILVEPVGVMTPHNGFQGKTRAKVLQLDHRIRLMPREEIRVEIVADSATTDWLMDQQPSVSVRQRWRLIQSYRPRVSDALANQAQADPNASIYGLTNSPLGLTAETPVVQRIGLNATREDATRLISMLAGSDPAARRRALIAISARMRSNDDAMRLGAPEIDSVIAAIMETYTRVGPNERAAMLLTLPQRHQVPQMISFDDHVAASVLSESLIDATTDPLVLACALLTRTDDPEAPIFETLANVADERVQRIAGIVRARLLNDQPLLGTVGPGLEAMTPSFDGLEL